MEDSSCGQPQWRKGDTIKICFLVALGIDQVQPHMNGWWWMRMNISGFNYLLVLLIPDPMLRFSALHQVTQLA